VLALLEAFKAIKEKHLEAKIIIDEATAQAEKIKKDANQKALSAYEEAYKVTLKQAEQMAKDLKRKAAKDAEHELENIRCQAEKQAKEIEAKAEKNFEKTVNAVLNMVLR